MRKLKLIIRRSKEYYDKFGFREMVKRAAVKLLHLDEVDYQAVSKARLPNHAEWIRQTEMQFLYEPLVSIIVPLYRTPLLYLEELVKSVQAQSYRNWELCLSDGSGEPSPVWEVLQQYAEADARIKIAGQAGALHIAQNTNHALTLAAGDYIAFMDHDDLLTPDALYECVRVLNESAVKRPEAMYSDEDKVTMDGTQFFQPHFKPDYNIDLLRSMNYICHLFVVSRELCRRVGSLRSEFDGAQDYDFILRCAEESGSFYHIPKVLYHWRAHKESTAADPDSKDYAVEAGRKALQSHYRRQKIEAEVLLGEGFGIYKTRFILAQHPKVSIIIPNKDHIEDLEQCIRSIEEKCRYDNYEYIIIENNSEKKETFVYYDRLQAANSHVKVVEWKAAFNYAAINNYGASYADGEYYLFLNNDTEMMHNDCIEELLGYCTREDVGIVGARLYYPDNIIQHAGIIIGYSGFAGHAFIGQLRGAPGYFSRIVCAQDYSAVTAACMMVKKHVFESVNGFDENYAVALNDVDLCLKVRAAGKLVVYNPAAELYHHESKSRGLEDTTERKERFDREIQLFQQKWKGILKQGDPCYNPNLTLRKPDFSIKPLEES